jgi:hypothetical protein
MTVFVDLQQHRHLSASRCGASKRQLGGPVAGGASPCDVTTKAFQDAAAFAVEQLNLKSNSMFRMMMLRIEPSTETCQVKCCIYIYIY